MDPITIGLMSAGAASTLAGLFGNNDDAQRYADQAIQAIIKAKIPDPEQQRLALEHYRSAGELTPELEHAIKEDPSSFQEIVQNQKYAQAQDRALGQLQSLGEEGGLNLSDKANLQEQLIQNSSKDKANRDAITDDMARRGQGGSGFGLQAQLEGAQSSGDRDAQARLQALGGAQDRALKAISDSGTMAGSMQSADYQRQADLAKAKDQISQFNTQNAQNVQQRNVATQNQDQAANLTQKQALMNSNTDLSNKEQQYNKELYQKQFDNQLDQGKALAGVYQNAENQANQQNAQKKQAYGAVGSGLGQIGTTIQSQNNWNDWLDSVKKKQPTLAT